MVSGRNEVTCLTLQQAMSGQMPPGQFPQSDAPPHLLINQVKSPLGQTPPPVKRPLGDMPHPVKCSKHSDSAPQTIFVFVLFCCYTIPLCSRTPRSNGHSVNFLLIFSKPIFFLNNNNELSFWNAQSTEDCHKGARGNYRPKQSRTKRFSAIV